MNGSSADHNFIREVPKSFDPAHPMRLAIETELHRQLYVAEAKGVIDLYPDLGFGRVELTLNLDDLAKAMIAHLNRRD
jgi:hypothetical protein